MCNVSVINQLRENGPAPLSQEKSVKYTFGLVKNKKNAYGMRNSKEK